ncbi:hypothetical protein [Alienimonas californiensis]|uniref:MgtE intracellular N domain protein n=1 Tax=Alienimonas californiensis TaxID=2527989 RepID=A0A517PE41_9PLAN|nr:hypothetical protein [Alienimonas californiensis]QDT17637.1 hypothetical protein CA12_37660 [Alienimonas californiensis]
MGRALATLFGVICIATVATQTLAVGVMWWHGRLTPSAWAEIAAALDGAPGATAPGDATSEATAPAGPTRTPTYEEVLERRAAAALQLADRTEALRSAARAVAAEAKAVADDRAALAADRTAFERELTQAREELTAEATEQARELVKGMGPKDSVGYLMSLPDLSVVTLVKGLDARTASKVLAEFAGGTEQERARGVVIFAALHAGQPEAAAIDAAAGGGPAPPGDPGG